jgi:ubiquinone/menaquinone biosynthesis C-methylase UbiE
MQGSYQFENLEGRQTEAAFLSERAQMRLEEFPGLLKRHGLPENGKVLEVGCGQGIRTKLMAEHFPNAEITGIDRSSELLAEARKHTPAITFIEADLYELPFSDASFDFVYARLVFMHLTDAERALKSLLRVLKPGGKILVEDADRDCMFFEPAPASFPSFWEKVQAGQRRLGGDPNVGRKLATYFKAQQLQNVQIETQPIVGGGAEIGFLVRTLLPSLNIYLDPGDRALGAAAILDLQKLSQDPTATFYHFWFVVSGAKQ